MYYHLLTLANLLVQFQYKQRLFLFSIYLSNEPRTFSNVRVPSNNLTMFLRYDEMCVTLLTSARDDDRYVTVLKKWTNRRPICTCHFLELHKTTFLVTRRDGDRSVPRNNRTSFQNTFGEMKVFRQMWREQIH